MERAFRMTPATLLDATSGRPGPKWIVVCIATLTLSGCGWARRLFDLCPPIDCVGRCAGRPQPETPRGCPQALCVCPGTGGDSEGPSAEAEDAGTH